MFLNVCPIALNSFTFKLHNTIRIAFKLRTDNSYILHLIFNFQTDQTMKDDSYDEVKEECLGFYCLVEYGQISWNCL